MTTEATAFDYRALPSERALEVRAVAERIHKRTTVAVIENGRDLLAVREMPEMKVSSPVQPDPERERRDHWIRKGLIEAVWGYAITCHKAQGSAWPNVLVFDDGLGRTAEDRARWLYTAITRAEKGLVLLD